MVYLHIFLLNFQPMENIQETLTPYEPPPQVYSAEPVLIAKPTVLSSEPKLYKPVVEEKKVIFGIVLDT